MNRAGAKTGLGGAFGMGLLVGVVAAPCRVRSFWAC